MAFPDKERPARRPAVEMKVLGGLHAFRIDGMRSTRVPLQAKRAALLAYLALRHNGERCSRASILALFWPELPEERAQTALRKATHELRSLLGFDLIRSEGSFLQLCLASVRCDALEFKEHIRIGALVAAASSYSGEFLEGYFPREEGLETWVAEQRSTLREHAYAATIALARADATKGHWEPALFWARKAEGLTNDQEEAGRLLVSLLHQSGNRGAAKSKYDRIITRLRTEFETDPSVETKALASHLRTPAHGMRQLPHDAAFFREIVECAADMIFCADADGVVTYVNEAGARLLGLSREEIIGRSYLEFVREDCRGAELEFHLRQTRQRDLTAYSEYPVARSDHTDLWLGQVVQLVCEDGILTGIRGIARDITPRRMRDEEERFRREGPNPRLVPDFD